MVNPLIRQEALFWKIVLIGLCLTGLSTGVIKGPEFWTSYVLDITGPAWCYILLRGQYNSKNATFFSIKFSSESALIIIVGICFIIEIMQYFNVYIATYDVYDFLSYFSGTFVVYCIDKWFILKNKKHN